MKNFCDWTPGDIFKILPGGFSQVIFRKFSERIPTGIFEGTHGWFYQGTHAEISEEILVTLSEGHTEEFLKNTKHFLRVFLNFLEKCLIESLDDV